MPRVAGRRGGPISESGSLRLSQQDRAAMAQIANYGRVGRADSALVNRRTVFGGKAAGLHDVFRAERDLGKFSVTRRPLRENLNPGVNGGVELADAIQAWLQRKLALLARSMQPLRQCFQARCLCVSAHCRREAGENEISTANLVSFKAGHEMLAHGYRPERLPARENI